MASQYAIDKVAEDFVRMSPGMTLAAHPRVPQNSTIDRVAVIRSLMTQIAELRMQRESLMEALGYYAEIDGGSIIANGGTLPDRARRALASVKEAMRGTL